MKYWITKWALTKGILEREVEDHPHGLIHNHISVYRPGRLYGDIVTWKYLHSTQEGAVDHARAMRDRKVLALRGQIKRLEKLDWSLE
jgi:hypothetical protein